MKKLNVVNLNNYVKPNPHKLVTQSNQYVTNGPDNDFFYYVEDRYMGSPTNQSVIDNIANYIMGKGLKVEEGTVDIKTIISEEDLRSFVSDFKIHGAGVLQVIYSYAREKKIAKLIYLPTRTIAIKKQADLSDDIEGYWYCYDWKNKTRFKPVFVPAFGYGVDNETEILYIKRPTPQPLFPLPDYLSGLQYAKTEEELSNYYVNHIQNNFAAGKIVNIYQGKDWTDDAMDEAEASILNKVKGTSNAGNIIVAFNDSTEGKTTVDSIEVTDAYQQFQTISKEAKENILLAHKIIDPALVGMPQPSGFSSQAEQMVMSLKMLYRSQINPMRAIITKGLETALKLNDPNVELMFEDFEELDVKEELKLDEIFAVIDKYQASVITYQLAILMISKVMNITLDEAKQYVPEKTNNDSNTIQE
jgi:hypothetical protein